MRPMANQVRYQRPPFAKPRSPSRCRMTANTASSPTFSQKRARKVMPAAASRPRQRAGRRARSGGAQARDRVEREGELREQLREPHQVGDEHAHRQAVEPRRGRPAEVDVHLPPVELLLKEGQDRGHAAVHAPTLDGEAVVVRRHAVGNRLARGEERDEGARGRRLHDVDLARAAEVDVERPVRLAEREQHLHRVVAAPHLRRLGAVAAREGNGRGEEHPHHARPEGRPVGPVRCQVHEAGDQDELEDERPGARGVVLADLLRALEVAVDEQAADVDAEARQQADGVHLGEDRLRALGEQDDARVEDRVQAVDAVERRPPVGRDQPVEAVAVRDPLEQLAMPTVTIATACGSPNPVTERATLVALSRIASGLPGAMCSRPSAIRLSSTMAATMKMPKVTRAFSRMPRMLSPATAQMMARMTPWYSAGPSGRNAVPLITALTVEMQAVRMYDTMIDATAMKEATGPSTK